ncbi:hypothetical protein SAMN02799631_04507, partial [Methylobacterium sp. 174MFSha1.1]
TITVLPVDDAPVLDLDASGPGTGFSSTYTENGAGVPIADTDVLIQDVDNTALASATVTITNGQAGDLLTAAGLPAGIGASYDAGSFTLTLSGQASLANYQAALAAVRFASTSENPPTLPRIVAVSVNDGLLGSAAAQATVNVVAVNDAPVNGLPASFAASEDTALALTGLSVADVDAAGGALSLTLSVGAGTGSLSAGASGRVTVTGSGTASLTLTGALPALNAYLASAAAPVFTPAANLNGAVALTLTTSDNGNTGAGGALTDVDTTLITLAPVNDAPVNTLPASFTTNEDTPLALTGLAVSDVDAGTGALTLSVGAGSGSLSATASGGVTVAGSGTASLTLTGTLPALNAYLASAAPVFTPVADANGAVTLTMTTNDGGNTGTGTPLTDTDTSTIVIAPVADIAGDTASTPEDTPVTLAVLANDSFENPGRTITAVNGAAISPGGAAVAVANGSVRLNADGTLTYAPSADYTGATSFTYTVTAGGVTETATVAVTVTPVNDA